MTAAMKSMNFAKSDFSVEPSTTKAISMERWQTPRVKIDLRNEIKKVEIKLKMIIKPSILG